MEVDLGSKYIAKLDSYLSENAESITCFELSELYFDFIRSIQSLGGDTRNLTGMTEFIFSRAYYYLNKNTIEKNSLIFGRALPGTLRQPDIVVFRGTTPLISIEVKSNYANVYQDYDRHKEVFNKHKNIMNATIAFEVEKKSDKKKNDGLLKESTFYQCLILNETHQNLKVALQNIRLIL
jgi:hypothetical protein